MGMSAGGMARVGCGCQSHRVGEQGMGGENKLFTVRGGGTEGGHNVF